MSSSTWIYGMIWIYMYSHRYVDIYVYVYRGIYGVLCCTLVIIWYGMMLLVWG